MESTSNQRLLAWLILLGLAFVWGSSFILMKVSLFDSDGAPMYSGDEVGAFRIFFSFLVLLPWVFSGVKYLKGKTLLALIAVGLFGNGIPAFIFATAQTELDSSYVGMLNSLVPLFTLLLAVTVFKVKISWLNALGICIGFGGAIGLILARGIDTSGELFTSSLMVIGATVCYAISVNTIRNFLSNVPSISITALAFLFIGPPTGIYLFTTDFTNTLLTHPEGWNGFAYMALLAVVGTAIAVILFNYLVKITSSIFAASVTYLIPIVAIFWGSIDGETIPLIAILCSVVILGGVYLVNFKPKSTSPK